MQPAVIAKTIGDLSGEPVAVETQQSQVTAGKRGNGAGKTVSRQVEKCEQWELGHLRGDGFTQPVVIQEEVLQPLKVAQSGGDAPGQRVCRQVKRFELSELA